MRNKIIYVARLWEKYLSKGNLIKHIGKAGLWTHGLDAWTLGAMTLGLWTLGRLQSGRLDAWTLDDWTLGL